MRSTAVLPLVDIIVTEMSLYIKQMHLTNTLVMSVYQKSRIANKLIMYTAIKWTDVFCIVVDIVVYKHNKKLII